MDWKKINIEQTGHDNIIEKLARIDSKQSRLAAARPLPAITTKSIKESLSFEWTYNSNSIEGNTLTLHETRIVIEEGITVKGKSLREHLEAVNHQDAIEYVESLAKPDYSLNEKDILEVHELVMDKIEKDFAGRFRNAGVRITGANFTPPNALKISDLVKDLIYWTNNEAGALHPIIKTSVFHHRFVWIHPFFDGNGRTARLLFNLLLMKDGYPPAIILKHDRKKYYEALNKANQGDYSKLILLIMQAAERSLDIYLSHIDNTMEDYQPIASIVAEPEMPYGQEYVSLLARQGKIDAYKEGNVWYTTEDAIKSYIRSRKRNKKTGS